MPRTALTLFASALLASAAMADDKTAGLEPAPEPEPVQACQATDLNDDGFRDYADVAVFIERFLAQHPTADMNNDGIVDFGDVSLFPQRFTEACEWRHAETSAGDYIALYSAGEPSADIDGDGLLTDHDVTEYLSAKRNNGDISKIVEYMELFLSGAAEADENGDGWVDRDDLTKIVEETSF